MSKAALGTSQWAVDRIRELEEENKRLRDRLTVNVDFWKLHAEIKDKANQEARARIDAALAVMSDNPCALAAIKMREDLQRKP